MSKCLRKNKVCKFGWHALFYSIQEQFLRGATDALYGR
jgi:hypothetical protein